MHRVIQNKSGVAKEILNVYSFLNKADKSIIGLVEIFLPFLDRVYRVHFRRDKYRIIYKHKLFGFLSFIIIATDIGIIEDKE